MKIEYELSRDDLVAFQMYHMANAKIFRRIQYIMMPLAALIVLAINWQNIREAAVYGKWGSLIMTVIFLTALLFLYKPMMRFTMKHSMGRLARQNPYILKRQSVEINEEGLRILNAAHERKTGWDGIERIEETGGYVFIYFDARSAHIVPKRAFGDKGQADAFVSMLRSKTGREIAL